MAEASDEFQLAITKHQKNMQRRAGKAAKPAKQGQSARVTPKGTKGGTPPRGRNPQTLAGLIPAAGPWSPPTAAMEAYFERRTFVFAPIEGDKADVETLAGNCKRLILAGHVADGGLATGEAEYLVNRFLALPPETVPGSVRVSTLPAKSPGRALLHVAFELPNEPGDDPSFAAIEWGIGLIDKHPQLQFSAGHTPARFDDGHPMVWGDLSHAVPFGLPAVEYYEPGRTDLDVVAQAVMAVLHILAAWSPTPLPPQLR